MSSEPDLIARREVVARTLFLRFKERSKARYPDPAGYALDEWENLPGSFKRDFYDDADAILATLEASDADTVTLIPTAAMKAVRVRVNIGEVSALLDPDTLDTVWRAMLTASHPKPEPVETQP